MVADANAQVVLVADDEEGLRESIQELLEGEGYRAIPAIDGEQALTKMAQASALDLAIIDLSMPGKSGREVIAAMRADPALKEVPVIAASGEALKTVEGAQWVLRKPYSAHQLLAAVRGVLAGPMGFR